MFLVKYTINEEVSFRDTNRFSAKVNNFFFWLNLITFQLKLMTKKKSINNYIYIESIGIEVKTKNDLLPSDFRTAVQTI